ncbi:MAG: hypothetical protein OEM38_00315 [Gammaproteobacteria bacterium]|nr:hypothetical protein [Gammaproteobacteria bacterium]
MITTTLSGLVFPHMTAAQMPQYQYDPVGYITDLSNLKLEPSYNTAVVQHIEKVAEKGRAFVSDVVEISSWYEPPVGGNIDTWA